MLCKFNQLPASVQGERLCGPHRSALVIIKIWASGMRKVLSWELGLIIDLSVSLSNGQVIFAGFHGYMETHLYFIPHKDELGA